MLDQLDIVVARPWCSSHLKICISVHFGLERRLPSHVYVFLLINIILTRSRGLDFLFIKWPYIFFLISVKIRLFLKPLCVGLRWHSDCVSTWTWRLLFLYPIALLFCNKWPVPLFTMTGILHGPWLAELAVVENVSFLQINLRLLIEALLTGTEGFCRLCVVNNGLIVWGNTADR